MGRFSKLELGAGARHEQERPRGAGQPASPLAREEEDLDAAGHLRRGAEHFFRADYESALRSYGRSLSRQSTLLDAWVGQIESLIAMGQIREAEVWTTRALTQFPDEPTILSLRGVLLARQGMLKRAMGTSDFALSRGHSRIAWIARGEILLMAGNKNASFCLEKALSQITPEDWQSLTRVGLVWLRHHRHSQALEVFQRAAAAEPRHTQLWRLIAECQSRLGFTDQAMASLRRVLEVEPGDRKAESALHRLAKTGPLTRLWRRITGKTIFRGRL
jgi:tetratricopeptide (TPR) repeat protein